MKAYDKDIASSDLLGSANTISFINLFQNDQLNDFDLDLFKDCKKTGNLKF